MAQAVRRSPPTVGVPSSRLGHSMWVSRWTKRGLGRFFAGFLPFSLTTNFIPPFLHTHLINFVSFHQSFLDSVVVSALARKARGPGSSSGPGEKFSFSILHYFHCHARTVNIPPRSSFAL